MATKKFLENSFLERIFSSRVRIHLLTHFLLHPGERDHIRALSSMVDAQYNAVWKELNNLEAAGVLSSEKVGGRKDYFLNQSSSIIPELRSILLKTVAVGDVIQAALDDLEGLETAFIYGSFATGNIDPESDVGLMLIGKLDLKRISPVIKQLETNLARAVNYITFTRNEWDTRKDGDDAFIENVLNDKKVFLVGEDDDL